jgi:hypothetical protein
MNMWDDLVFSRPSISNYNALVKSLLFVTEYLYKRGLCTLLVRIVNATEVGDTPDRHENETSSTNGDERDDISLSTVSSPVRDADEEGSIDRSLIDEERWKLTGATLTEEGFHGEFGVETIFAESRLHTSRPLLPSPSGLNALHCDRIDRDNGQEALDIEGMRPPSYPRLLSAPENIEWKWGVSDPANVLARVFSSQQKEATLELGSDETHRNSDDKNATTISNNTPTTKHALPIVSDDEQSRGSSCNNATNNTENGQGNNSVFGEVVGTNSCNNPVMEIIMEEEKSKLCHHPNQTPLRRRRHRITSTIQTRLNQLRIPTHHREWNNTHKSGDDNEHALDPIQPTHNSLFAWILSISKCNVYRMAMAIAAATLDFIVYHLQKKGLDATWRLYFSFVEMLATG